MKNGITQGIIKLVRRCDLNSLKKILDESTVSEINVKEKGMGYSLLTSAVSFVQPKVVKLLLSYGADPNSLDKYGRTPLFYAGERYTDLDYDSPDKHLEMANLLLDYKADLNIVDNKGEQALFNAVFTVSLGEFGYLPLVGYYLEKGADPNFKNNRDFSPLDVANRSGYKPLIELLNKRK